MARRETERDRLMREAREARAASGASSKMTFSEWFENVFRPHYMWPTIGGIVVIAVLIALLSDFIGQVKPDFTLTVASTGLFREEDAAELKTLIEDTVGDVNGDGEVSVVIDIYTAAINVDTSTDDLGAGATGTNAISGFGGSDDTASQMLQAFDIAFMSDEQNVLYLLDDTMASRYETDYFEYLADYGYTAESPVLYPANGLPIMERIFMNRETPFWFCFRGWAENKKDSAEHIGYYELAVKVLDAIIAAE